MAYDQVCLKVRPAIIAYYVVSTYFKATKVPGSYYVIIWVSMTSLLTHTVAHSTRPFFRPKTNNQPLKKFLSLAFS